MMILPRPFAKAVYQAAVVAAGERRLFARLRELEAMQWGTVDELRAYQEDRLLQILSHARSSCPFYEDRIPALASTQNIATTLSSVPTLDKGELQRSANDMRSLRCEGPVSRKTTGGSTGEPVTIVKDRTATAYERAAMWLAYGWFGVEMGDRAARFWGTPFTWKRRLTSRIGDLCMNRIRFSAFEFDDHRLREYWNRLERFDPDYIHGYVSMLEQMARWVLHENAGARLTVKSVVATSEVLTDPQRRVIEKAFDAPVQVEYGCGEVGPISHECSAGRLHIMAPNLWVELLGPDGTPVPAGEIGEIVLTDLHNRAMPLIRYRVGDYGARGSACPCGRSFPVMEKVWGRAYDFVETPNGQRYHGEFFMYLFEDLRSRGVPIQQFQVIQRTQDRLAILITCDQTVGSSTVESIVRTLSRRLPDMNAYVQQVSEIPRTPSGKMQVIKREDIAKAPERHA